MCHTGDHYRLLWTSLSYLIENLSVRPSPLTISPSLQGDRFAIWLAKISCWLVKILHDYTEIFDGNKILACTEKPVQWDLENLNKYAWIFKFTLQSFTKSCVLLPIMKDHLPQETTSFSGSFIQVLLYLKKAACFSKSISFSSLSLHLESDVYNIFYGWSGCLFARAVSYVFLRGIAVD